MAPTAGRLAAAAPRPRPTFALRVVGDEANDDKRHRCRARIFDLGGRLERGAPVLATLALSSRNHLRVTSTTRGPIFEEGLPPWPVADLCHEVMRRASRALRDEPAVTPSPVKNDRPQ
jgi:hypothetical protein